MRSLSISLIQLSVLSALVFQAPLPAFAAGPVNEAAMRSAWALYTQQKYAASADAFEVLIRNSTPDPRLYYYAAMANRGSNRVPRAKQLCQYLITNFPATLEANSARTMFVDSAPAVAAAGASNSGLNLGGKSLDELMQTEEGRQMLKEALSKQKSSAAATPPAIPQKTPDKNSSPAKVTHSPSVQSQNVFSAATIAELGPDGVTQFDSYPDCWFEASMVALARLPRGQALLAQMIRCPGSDGTCIVRFPNDGVDYTITPKKLEAARVHDKALWASLIHCAQLMKFRSHSGAIEDGLSCLTGKKADKLFSSNTTEQALISFVGDAVKAQEPIVCLSSDEGAEPELAESDHAYAIIDFDPGTKMITLKNPHGDNSRRFRLTTDPDHKKFEQLNNGMFKMHVSLFPRYFSQIARSSI